MKPDFAYYTTTEAAEYCGLTRAGFVYHLQAGHVVEDFKIGWSLIFTQATLDAFDQVRRNPGRPTRQPTP